jgi:predicted 3-demethylubiquinone-9 3-methyltransferase (glyoxalase superfamily)
MMSAPDKEKSARAIEAILQMKKLDIAELERAFEGETASWS